MSAPTLLPACPTCNGPRLLGHPLGLVFWHDPACALGVSEDARQAADAELRGAGAVRRPSTLSEKHLLRAAGVNVFDDVETEVQWVSNGARRRTWRDCHGDPAVVDAADPA